MEPTKNKVLVIEDDEAIRTALRIALTGAGLVVFEAKDGTIGFGVASKECPDLILLDILMPEMDGWMMLQKVREKDEWGRCVPVIVLTNLNANDDAQIRHIAELGPSFFMVKADWKIEGIVDKVLEILNEPEIPCP